MGVQVSAWLCRIAVLYEVIAMAVVLLNEFGFSGEIFYLNQYFPVHHAPISRGNKAGLLDLDHSQINNLWE